MWRGSCVSRIRPELRRVWAVLTLLTTAEFPQASSLTMQSARGLLKLDTLLQDFITSTVYRQREALRGTRELLTMPSGGTVCLRCVDILGEGLGFFLSTSFDHSPLHTAPLLVTVLES